MMTFLRILSIICIITSFELMSQSDKPRITQDSIGYSDTVWSEIVPELINFADVRKMIIYPETAIEDETEGRVVIKCLIGHEGNVEKTGTITGPPIFYDEIRRVVMFLKFTPGMVNSYPVKVWVSVPFNFEIKRDK
jgi:TonB family protein